jgi:Ferritin-like
MLHLALVQNVLSAIGAAPHLTQRNLPARPTLPRRRRSSCTHESVATAVTAQLSVGHPQTRETSMTVVTTLDVNGLTAPEHRAVLDELGRAGATR